jgi:serine kinase of HPr protein (carbohydrate metabolism regulator)
MNPNRISSENLHATCVASNARAVLIVGPSGSGKSDLALRMLDRGFSLVSDDRTVVRKEGEKLIASAPVTIRGKLEIRGIGIVDMESTDDVTVALVVELTADMQRMPDDSRERLILGTKVPMVNIDAMTASAPSKVAVALDRLGLKF